MRDAVALARHVNLLSALTSEIRDETSDDEIRRFIHVHRTRTEGESSRERFTEDYRFEDYYGLPLTR
jgi:hypothetical protein